MHVTKKIDLNLLAQELTAASVSFNDLGLEGDDTDAELYTYDAQGEPTELPAGAASVVQAHVAPPPSPILTANFETGSPTEQQIKDGADSLRAYINNPSPTNAESVATIKLLARGELFLLKKLRKRLV